jgi:hypothetical protein
VTEPKTNRSRPYADAPLIRAEAPSAFSILRSNAVPVVLTNGTAPLLGWLSIVLSLLREAATGLLARSASLEYCRASPESRCFAPDFAALHQKKRERRVRGLPAAFSPPMRMAAVSMSSLTFHILKFEQTSILALFHAAARAPPHATGSMKFCRGGQVMGRWPGFRLPHGEKVQFDDWTRHAKPGSVSPAAKGHKLQRGLLQVRTRGFFSGRPPAKTPPHLGYQ